MIVLYSALVSSASGQGLPVSLGDSLFIEEAWALPSADGADIFVVINNSSLVGVGPLDIRVEGAASSRVVKGDGEPFAPEVPGHAELYMQPGGVRIQAVGLQPAATIPVSISFGGMQVVVEARVLIDGEAQPDHHDYDHG